MGCAQRTLDRRGVLHGPPAAGGAASRVLEVGRIGFFRLLLRASSVTRWRAERELRTSDQIAFLRWLRFTLVRGAVFLVNQALEYVGLRRRGVTINTSLF